MAGVLVVNSPATVVHQLVLQVAPTSPSFQNETFWKDVRMNFAVQLRVALKVFLSCECLSLCL